MVNQIEDWIGLRANPSCNMSNKEPLFEEQLHSYSEGNDASDRESGFQYCDFHFQVGRHGF